MSLFKVRDIWSFDLEELQRHSSDAQTGDINCKAQFIADIGQWPCIGNQDVFVCGNLRGHLFIIQVPESDQRKHIKSTLSKDIESPRADAPFARGANQNPQSDLGERQILAAYELDAPLVDLKCGYFTSSLRQSVAALTPEKLVVLQIKHHQVDLLSAPNLGDVSESREKIDKSLLSHEFEVYMNFNLLEGQFAYHLLVLNIHAESSLVEAEVCISERNTHLAATPSSLEAKFKKTSRKIVQQLRLPQRDKIIVQYVDQFLFTMIDSKKVIGHFSLGRPERPLIDGSANQEQGSEDQQELKLKQMEHASGCMPMANLINGNTSNLVVSFSDFRIHSLPMDMLVKQAKQNVMKRVALDLLGARTAPSKSQVLEAQQTQGRSELPPDELIRIDLDATADWSRELLGSPIAMQGLTRQVKVAQTLPQGQSTSIIAQLLVMSRYSLDLFSHTGVHLWSQSFETPLTCMHAYTTAARNPADDRASDGVMKRPPAATNDPSAKPLATLEQYSDKLVTLLCSDNLSDDKSNLTIMSDDVFSWSSLLNSKPLSVWRLNLSRMPGLLATLDLSRGQLVASYLGTNSGSDAIGEPDVARDDANHLVELERLDETLHDESTQDSSKAKDDLRQRLSVLNSLEANPEEGSVKLSTNIQLDSTSKGVVIHNLFITFEYDDLLRFASGESDEVNYPARGVAQIRLGSCWPDRRDPIKLETTFSLPSSAANRPVGVAAIDNLSEVKYSQDSDLKLLPKTLKVKQHFDYNETHSDALHEERELLLPLSMITQLVHIDYSSGQGQELEDVLGNLNRYQRDDGSTPSLYCDLFLKLSCDFMSLIDDFVCCDLMGLGCDPKASNLTAGNRQLSSRRTETLGNINQLAHSLDWRTTSLSSYPGLIRQSSEDSAQIPIMLSIALKLGPDKLERISNAPALDAITGQTVWIHLCDFSPENRVRIVEEFVQRHIRDWKRFQGDSALEQVSPDTSYNSSTLISIESDQPLPVAWILDHLVERLKLLDIIESRLGIEFSTPEHSPISFDTLDNGNRLAVSSKLHDLLVALGGAYGVGHKARYKQLESELLRNYCKFRVVTKASLSLAKRLPSLPDNMGNQVTSMALLVKHYQKSLSSILDELERLKRLDYERSKIPEPKILKVRPPGASRTVPWWVFEPVAD